MGLINAGQRVTADELNALESIIALKLGAQHYTNTTLSRDDDLVLSVDANTNYLFQSFLVYEGGPSGSSDIQVEWTVPSGSTLRYSNIGDNQSGGTTGSFCFVQSNVITAQTSGSGSLRALTMIGSLLVGNSSGVLQLFAAQNTSNSNDTIIHAQSYVTLQEVS